MKNTEKLDHLLRLVDAMHDTEPDQAVRIGDSRDGRFYRHDERTRVAVKVALITGRPLLLVGPPGCGKSSLAPYVARNLSLRYDFYTVTETAEASDLLWSIDYLRRLNDAQGGGHDLELSKYVDHGVLWRAFEHSTTAAHENDLGYLVLIDEIDKADAGFANSLLVAMGSLKFDVPPLKRTVEAQQEDVILVIMTSNEERELPPALVRRCVQLRVQFPTAKELVEIAASRWTWMEEPEFRSSVERLAERLVGETPGDRDVAVSTAEFLDLVQVLRQSGISPTDPRWRTVESLVLRREETE